MTFIFQNVSKTIETYICTDYKVNIHKYVSKNKTKDLKVMTHSILKESLAQALQFRHTGNERQPKLQISADMTLS